MLRCDALSGSPRYCGKPGNYYNGDDVRAVTYFTEAMKMFLTCTNLLLFMKKSLKNEGKMHDKIRFLY